MKPKNNVCIILGGCDPINRCYRKVKKNYPQNESYKSSDYAHHNTIVLCPP